MNHAELIHHDLGPKEPFYMVLAPRGEQKGVKPYGQPSADPNKAIMSAVKRHFGSNCTKHQMRAQWQFLVSRGFLCKRVTSMTTEEFTPTWIEDDKT